MKKGKQEGIEYESSGLEVILFPMNTTISARHILEVLLMAWQSLLNNKLWESAMGISCIAYRILMLY